MITNKFFLILIALIACVILLNIYRNNNSDLEPFGMEAPTPQKLAQSSNENKDQYLTTPVKGLTLDFKYNRPYAKDLPYDKKFDDLRKDKPLMLISEDKLFSDIVPYDNQLDGRLGLDICLEKCDGECLEYGQTGNAYCFPNDGKTVIKSNYYETLRDNSYKYENTDEAPQKIIYPNLR